MSLPGWCEYEDVTIEEQMTLKDPVSYKHEEAKECARRNDMWKKLIPEWNELCKNAKKKRKMAYAAKYDCLPHHIVDYTYEYTDDFSMKFIPVIDIKDGYVGKKADVIILDDFAIEEELAQMNTTHLYRTEESRKQMKDDLMDCLVDIGTSASTTVGWNIPSCSSTTTVTYAPMPVDVPQVPKGYGKQPSKKENNMGYEINTAFIENDQRRHLKSRLQNVRWTKDTDLITKFHMGNVKIKDKDDLIAAMKDGRLQILKEAFNEDGKLHGYYSYMDTFVFRDKDRDEEGYKAASAAMDKAFVEAADKITILSPKEGLDVLNAFEAQTF